MKRLASAPERPDPGSTTMRRIDRFENGRWTTADDHVATEEPLEIRLVTADGAPPRTLSLTMRTPGDDVNLATGLLLSEGIVANPRDVLSMEPTPLPGEHQEFNSILVRLSARARVDWERLERPLMMTSACGVCGRAALDYLRDSSPPSRKHGEFRIPAAVLESLPAELRGHQRAFERTGGIHAAALFDRKGTLADLREDVGRHNAVDKLLGAAFRAGRVPLNDSLLLVSGRASFEILQKAARAGIPLVASVGAPSSLAIAVAEEFGITLVGFLKTGRFNVYTNPQRAGPTRP